MTGDARYAQKAIALMDAWSAVITRIRAGRTRDASRQCSAMST
ncbi:hypothetical protein [Amycolatopsis sp. NPDC051716]